jgi:hypothetical protein
MELPASYDPSDELLLGDAIRKLIANWCPPLPGDAACGALIHVLICVVVASNTPAQRAQFFRILQELSAEELPRRAENLAASLKAHLQRH